MTSNNEDEENSEFIPITSDTIKEIAETSTASKKSRKKSEEKTGRISTMVIKYHNNHECSVDARKSYQKHATSTFISEQILEHVRDKKIEVTPAFVESEMKKKFGFDIGYHKAWRAIQKDIASIRRTPEENYQILPSYLYMMVHRNPETFAYMFFAPAASIVGWCYCRPVIAVDAIFLKSKYRGVLFVVVSKDANNQIFPLSFGVVDSENNDAYIWFFGEMRKAIQVRRELVFLSDRNQSIANGIRKVYPEAHHGIRLYHFEKHLKQRRAKATVINLFQSAARSYKREDFNQLMSQIKSVDKKTYNYIIEELPERWARSWFLRRRYDMLTTNMVESMNSVLLKVR
uniref:Protein FAR1-RELATED SEQUENCE 8-like n=1 Tax=Nicotiana tabacum TaxID=4097 RepID=A0A1S4DR98_TOBAC|nr:PREDICTED: protein FAR1-RELATED SEQUENCE 8-like [Nicotiana tabacum]